ncbi:MAG TPA: transcription elongation factor Spt5, partial [Candidatus Methanomethylia archaeon]|nr:transcription elongation factor Spt5 [Candidatus Methanomethylicia archaeon]
MSKETTPQTRLYAVRTTAGQEANVALLIERRAIAQKLPVKAVVAPDAVKGYVFVEAPGPHVVDLAVTGL